MNDDTPETVQTVQETPTRQPFFECAPDDNGEWHWCLWSGNGRAMAMNAIPYKKRNDCTNAIDAIMQAGINPGTRIVIAHTK